MNMYTRKISIISILALALLFGVSACKESSSDSPTDSPAVEEEVVAAPDSSGDASDGQSIYNGLCVACHGADATGVTGLGKNLIESELVANSTDAELAAFIAEGRPASHPDNTTGVDMPPRGGNPSLTDDDLLSVVAYLRSLIGE